MLLLQVLMRLLVFPLQRSVQRPMLPSSHRVPMRCSVFGVELSMFSVMLGVQALMLSSVFLILVMSRDNRGGKQQAGEWQHSK